MVMRARTTWPIEYDYDGLLSSTVQVTIKTSSTLPPLPYGGRTTFPSEGWGPLAACLDKTEEMFGHRCNAYCHRHGGRECIISDRVAYAKSICAACPVLAHCRIWAIESELECGIAGGMTEAERRWFKVRYLNMVSEQLTLWHTEPVEQAPAERSTAWVRTTSFVQHPLPFSS